MKQTYFIALSLIVLIPFQSFSKAEKGKAPVELSANILNSTTVKLNWMGTQKDFAYRIRFRPIDVLTWSVYNVEAPTCTRRISDLKPGTTYQWQVQTQFSKSMRDTSGFVNGPNFTPWEPCETPQGLVTMIDGLNTAALIWLPVGDDVKYKVRLRTEGTKEWTTYTTDKNVLTLDDLEQGKGYEWDVTAQCKKSGLQSEVSDKSFFAASPNVIDNTPIGNYGYNGSQLLTFNVYGNDVIEATLQNHMGEHVEKLPVYYLASNGTVAFNVDKNLPPGLYNIAYRCGSDVQSRTLLIAEK